MRKIVCFLTVFILLFSTISNAFAADGTVTYDGSAQKFVFKPGSEQSPTDLFPNFKGVMPGDTILQKITVKNDASNGVKAKIYLRSLGAHPESEKFLQQLRLSVKPSAQNEMAYMFDAAANETAQLTDWVCLGTLYSGGIVDLDVLLTVPVELDNEFQSKIGYLDWEFKVEELPVQQGDPVAPPTGGSSNLWLWWVLAGVSLAAMLWIIWKKGGNRRENPQKTV